MPEAHLEKSEGEGLDDHSRMWETEKVTVGASYISPKAKKGQAIVCGQQVGFLSWKGLQPSQLLGRTMATPAERGWRWPTDCTTEWRWRGAAHKPLARDGVSHAK